MRILEKIKKNSERLGRQSNQVLNLASEFFIATPTRNVFGFTYIQCSFSMQAKIVRMNITRASNTAFETPQLLDYQDKIHT